MKRVRLLAVALLSLPCVISSAQTSPNLLADPGFEEWAGDPWSTNWVAFNSAFCFGESARTRTYAVKMHGNFKGEETVSGIYQDVPAQAGKRYQATGYFIQNSGDHLDGQNAAWVKLEFLGPKRNKPLAVFESPVKLEAKSAANKFIFLSTGPGTAPEGTAFARFVAIFQQQADNAVGAAYVDDVSLREIP